MKCLRCDWQHDRNAEEPAREQMKAHVLEAEHPTCSVCRKALTTVETATCEGCLTGARETLSGIVTLWLELPGHLGQLTGAGASGTRPAADGRPLPGGDVLVLLGPGSIGTAEDGETTRDGDPTSVAFDLTWWEARWRLERRDPEAQPARLGAAVRRAAGYLEVHTRWAAENLDGFADYVDDLQLLHGRLERATGRARIAAKANASCFDCGGVLVRRVGDDGLEEDHVTCKQCRRHYSPTEYTLALRAVRESGLQGWVPISEAAKFTRRSVETLESWSKRLMISACCVFEVRDDGKVTPGRKLVWWPDVEARVLQSRSKVRAS